MTAEIIVLIVLLPILFLITFNDYKTLRIPNILVILILLTFVLGRMPFLPLTETITRVVVSLILFVLLLGLYFFGRMGAGDVKTAAAISLHINPALYIDFMLLLSLCCLSNLLLVMAIRKWMVFPMMATDEPTWRDWSVWKQSARLPLGAPIACSALLVLILEIYQMRS